MIARIKAGEIPAWTKGDVWHSDNAVIAMILNGRASRKIVHDECGYTPDIANEMARYAEKNIPNVTIVSLGRSRSGKLDADGYQIIY